MSDWFSHLIERHRGIGPMVAPRTPCRFETQGAGLGVGLRPVPENDLLPVVEKVWQTPDPTEPAAVAPAAPPHSERTRVEPGKTHETGPQPNHDLRPNATVSGPLVTPNRPPIDTAESRPLVDAPRPQAPPPARLSREAHASEPLRPAPPEIQERLTRVIVRSAERLPGIMPRSTAGTEKVQGQPQLIGAGNRVVPGTAAAPSVPGPASGESLEPPHGPEQMQPGPAAQEARLPELRMNAGRAQPRHAPAAAERRPSGALEPRTPVRNAAGTAREHLLVPPDWLAQVQSDLQARRTGTRVVRPEPAIHVTIGRVELRAEAPPPTHEPRAKEKPPALMSLDEYLRQRAGRGPS